MEGVGLGNMNILCVFRLLVLFIYFALNRKERAFIFLFPFFACSVCAVSAV